MNDYANERVKNTKTSSRFKGFVLRKHFISTATKAVKLGNVPSDISLRVGDTCYINKPVPTY